MKAVLLSVQRPYCELEISGYKRLEIRKTAPKIETPFVCYIYCTRERLPWIDRRTGQRLDGYVIGEFVCDRIRQFAVPPPTAQDALDEGILDQSCLSYQELYGYARRKKLYGWHIAGLKVYEKPLPLEAFGFERAPQSWRYVEEKC